MKTILLSRTDNIGDVILTLPMAGMIKKYFPKYRVLFLAKGYTLQIARRCVAVDEVYDWEKVRTGEEKLPYVNYFIHVFPNPAIAKFANKLKITSRVGTSHRFYHWWTCNLLANFSRKRSDLHESQLNMMLLRSLGLNEIPLLAEMHELVSWKSKCHQVGKGLLTEKFNLILHTKSLGSAKDWPLSNFLQLAKELPVNQFQLYITGTSSDGEYIKKEISEVFSLPNVTDVTGRFELDELISFIELCDGLLASSTGPLHIASVAGIKTLGLYPAQRPMHAGRWAPIGKSVQIISENPSSNYSHLDINVAEVKKVIEQWI